MKDHIVQFFSWAHLADEEMRSLAARFADLAQQMVDRLPQNPERTAMLRKLLEAKDCAVRAHIAKPTEE